VALRKAFLSSGMGLGVYFRRAFSLGGACVCRLLSAYSEHDYDIYNTNLAHAENHKPVKTTTTFTMSSEARTSTVARNIKSRPRSREHREINRRQGIILWPISIHKNIYIEVYPIGRI